MAEDREKSLLKMKIKHGNRLPEAVVNPPSTVVFNT